MEKDIILVSFDDNWPILKISKEDRSIKNKFFRQQLFCHKKRHTLDVKIGDFSVENCISELGCRGCRCLAISKTTVVQLAITRRLKCIENCEQTVIQWHPYHYCRFLRVMRKESNRIPIPPTMKKKGIFYNLQQFSKII